MNRSRSLENMGVPSGVLIVCQPASNIMGRVADVRPSNFVGDLSLYGGGERVRDPLLSSDEAYALGYTTTPAIPPPNPQPTPTPPREEGQEIFSDLSAEAAMPAQAAAHLGKGMEETGLLEGGAIFGAAALGHHVALERRREIHREQERQIREAETGKNKGTLLKSNEGEATLQEGKNLAEITAAAGIEVTSAEGPERPEPAETAALPDGVVEKTAEAQQKEAKNALEAVATESGAAQEEQQKQASDQTIETAAAALAPENIIAQEATGAQAELPQEAGALAAVPQEVPLEVPLEEPQEVRPEGIAELESPEPVEGPPDLETGTATALALEEEGDENFGKDDEERHKRNMREEAEGVEESARMTQRDMEEKRITREKEADRIMSRTTATEVVEVDEAAGQNNIIVGADMSSQAGAHHQGLMHEVLWHGVGPHAGVEYAAAYAATPQGVGASPAVVQQASISPLAGVAGAAVIGAGVTTKSSATPPISGSNPQSGATVTTAAMQRRPKGTRMRTAKSATKTVKTSAERKTARRKIARAKSNIKSAQATLGGQKDTASPLRDPVSYTKG